ncbi:MAG: hypothetical protein WAV28_06495 [Sedimentisphaerales bacterium]|jgi:hypothetical protein
MNALLAQIISLARRNDMEGWMDILILVIVAAVYGLGAILKTKKGKKVQEQTEQPQTRKPQRKPAAGRGVLEQFFKEILQAVEPAQEREPRPAAQQARPKVARPQPAQAVRKYTAEAKQASRTIPAAPAEEPKRPGLELSIPAPKVQPAFEEIPELGTSILELPDFTSKGVEELVGKGVDMPAEVVESRYLSEVLSDYADPEELRRAILHYEILGRPLSLRAPSGQIIGL